LATFLFRLSTDVETLFSIGPKNVITADCNFVESEDVNNNIACMTSDLTPVILGWPMMKSGPRTPRIRGKILQSRQSKASRNWPQLF